MPGKGNSLKLPGLIGLQHASEGSCKAAATCWQSSGEGGGHTVDFIEGARKMT